MITTEWDADAGDGFWSMMAWLPTAAGTRVYRPEDPAVDHLVVHEVTWCDIYDRQDGPYMLVNPAYQLAAGGGPPSHDPSVSADAGIPGQVQPGNPPFIAAPEGTVSLVLRIVDKGPYEHATGLLEHGEGYEPFEAEVDAVRGALTSTRTIFGGLVATRAHFH